MFNLLANWPAPPHIQALTTTKLNGFSAPPYAENNLALHVGDHPPHVLSNRARLMQSLNLPSEPAWLEQTHSTDCILIDEDTNRVGDAAISRRMSTPLVIMTADCLPIVLCDHQGTEIAAIHAGWRGLVNGIVDNTLSKMQSDKTQLMAWIGPAICQSCFEIGIEVKNMFLSKYPFTQSAFHEKDKRLYADLPKLAELVLTHNNVLQVYQSNACTYEQHDAFYSYRRTAQTGRMATLIWSNKIKAR